MVNFSEVYELRKDKVLTDPENFNYIFKNIDSAEKAYFLGRMCYFLNDTPKFENLSIDERIDPEYIRLTFNHENIPEICRNFLYCDKILCDKSSKYYTFGIPKNFIQEIVLNYNFVNENLKFYYYRGIIENYAQLYNYTLELTLNNKPLLMELCKYFNLQIPKFNTLIIKDINCIDFLGILYKEHKNLSDYYFINKFQNLIYKYNNIDTKGSPMWSIIKTDPNAVIPFKTNFSDIGFDVTVIKKVKDLTNTTSLYDTGFVVIPPLGYYIEVFPRSSLSKSGFVLSNSVGLIDPSYRGNLFISLTNTDPTKSIDLPFRCCQIVLKKHEIIQLKEIDSIDSTNRGTGGFGSTG